MFRLAESNVDEVVADIEAIVEGFTFQLAGKAPSLGCNIALTFTRGPKFGEQRGIFRGKSLIGIVLIHFLTSKVIAVIIHTMNVKHLKAPISDLLRRTIAESGVSYRALQKETGVTRASIMRFVRGDQSIRLDIADRLATYFGLELVKRGRK